jgi:hypothetical protein
LVSDRFDSNHRFPEPVERLVAAQILK